MADIRIKGQNRSGMRQGFIKVAAVTPKIKVADPVYNGTQICQRMEEACARGAKIIVFPELCITGYTCGDLFMQQLLLEEASRQLLRIAEATAGRDALVMVGLPMEREGRLYNVAAVLWQGQVLGLVPKANIPSYAEFYEGRHFARATGSLFLLTLRERSYPSEPTSSFPVRPCTDSLWAARSARTCGWRIRQARIMP